MKTFFRIVLVVSALFGGVSLAAARVNETLEQCIARYGKPVLVEDKKDEIGGKVYTFDKNGYAISIIFLEGHAAFLFFNRADKTSLSGAEVQALLTANQGEMTWTQKNDTTWFRSDEVLANRVTLVGVSRLLFMTKAYHEAQEAASKEGKKKAAALGGF